MSKIDLNIGFIGTGGIASALAKGLCLAEAFTGKIYVFDIDAQRTEALREQYPQQVVVAESNQQLLDEVEVVFPTLLPGVLEKVAPTLRFREEHRIIHIAAGTKIAKAAPWFAPARSVVRAVPLPFASRHIGPIVLYGDDPVCESLLALLGAIVKVKSEKDLEVLAAVTGMMVSYYGLVGAMVRWCMSKGMEFHDGLDYTSYMNEALSTYMREECTEDVEAFMQENATPHGMNELGWKIMRETGAYQPWVEALEQIGKHYDL